MLNELYETEKSFVSVLELVSQDFYLALKDHLHPDDTELLFAIARVSCHGKVFPVQESGFLA